MSDTSLEKTSTAVGFIGLGNLGTPIATTLLADGHSLTVYNRTASKAEPLVAKGARLAKSAKDAAPRGGVVFSVVADDAALIDVCDAGGVAEALGSGGLHISISTVSPATSRRLERLHERHGAAFVAAPIFARPEAAAARKGFFCVSGKPAARERATKLLTPLCAKVYDYGDAVGAANVIKLCGNFMLTAAIETMAEAAAMAEKNGIPRGDMLKLFTETLFACPIYQNYGQRIVAGDFDHVGFSVKLALKDMTLAADTAAAQSVPMPIVNLLRDRYMAQISNGHGGLDATALSLGASGDAGLKWFKK